MQRMTKTLRRQVAACAGVLRREDGSVAIEAMIILPAVFWTFLATFSIYETFRVYSITQKAAFTVSDAVSRETLPIDDAYLDGMHDLFDYLSLTTGSSAIRVSSIRYDADNDRYWRDWSQVRGEAVALTDADVESWHDRLPVMPNGERVVLLESWTTFTPPFDVGLTRQDIHNFVFTRPRYAPRVCWQTCD